jgi:hypothetical protein
MNGERTVVKTRGVKMRDPSKRREEMREAQERKRMCLY